MEDEQSFTDATLRQRFLNDFEDRRYQESAGSRMLYVKLPEFEESPAPGPWLQMAEQQIDDESPIYLSHGEKPSNQDESYTVLEDHAWRMAALRGSIVACVMLASQRMYLGHFEEAFRWVSRASLIISDIGHWRSDLEYAGWTEIDITLWASQQRSTLDEVNKELGHVLSFAEPRDLSPNRESIEALGVEYCIVCGFATSFDRVCDHSLVLPYQSSKADKNSSDFKAQLKPDNQGISTLPFCQNCGHAFASKAAKFCPSCGFAR